MKKGFTLIELLISITVLATIMIVVMALYSVAIREYPINFQKVRMQANVNYTSDAMAQTAKSAYSLPPSYGDYVRSATVMILEVPATDTNGNFIYNGSSSEKDIFIYQLVDGKLEKRIYGNNLGRYAGQNGEPSIILDNVKSFNCVYSNQVSGLADYYKTVVFTLSAESVVVGKTISFNIIKTANLRNAP